MKVPFGFVPGYPPPVNTAWPWWLRTLLLGGKPDPPCGVPGGFGGGLPPPDAFGGLSPGGGFSIIRNRYFLKEARIR